MLNQLKNLQYFSEVRSSDVEEDSEEKAFSLEASEISKEGIEG